MVGLPGAGKDTYIKKHLAHLPMLSFDALRTQFKVRRGDETAEGHMYQHAQELMREYLRQKQDFVINVTQLTRALRGKLIQRALNYHACCLGIYIEPQFSTVARQNKNRAAAVPQTSLEHLYDLLEVPAVGEFHELQYIW
jgi:predicted kinase